MLLLYLRTSKKTVSLCAAARTNVICGPNEIQSLNNINLSRGRCYNIVYLATKIEQNIIGNIIRRRRVAGIQKTGFLLQTTMSRAGSIMSGPVLIKHTTKWIYIYMSVCILLYGKPDETTVEKNIELRWRRNIAKIWFLSPLYLPHKLSLDVYEGIYNI